MSSANCDLPNHGDDTKPFVKMSTDALSVHMSQPKGNTSADFIIAPPPTPRSPHSCVSPAKSATESTSSTSKA
jgi:hypothetical protein